MSAGSCSYFSGNGPQFKQYPVAVRPNPQSGHSPVLLSGVSVRSVLQHGVCTATSPLVVVMVFGCGLGGTMVGWLLRIVDMDIEAICIK